MGLSKFRMGGNEYVILRACLQVKLRLAKTEQQQQRIASKQKLIIILVGLPARGKTFLCTKIMCYLNW